MVTFAPILKYNIFPLPEIVETLLNLGSKGMGSAVEIEFAADLSRKNKEFGVLQMRPLVVHEEVENINMHDLSKNDLLCKSDDVLGSGINNDIRDIICVDKDSFDRSKTKDIASEVSQLNSEMLEKANNTC